MKVPNIFIPEKDLTGTINKYLEGEENFGKNGYVHSDPNLNHIIASLAVLLRLEGRRGLSPKEISKLVLDSEEKNCMITLNFLSKIEYDKNIDDNIFYSLKTSYAQKIEMDIVNSCVNEKSAIQNRVIDYVNMVIGVDAENLGPNNTWKYLDPKTKTPKTIKIDLNYMHKIENHLGLSGIDKRESFRQSIRKIYGTKLSTDPNYDFMDNLALVGAVTDVILKSELFMARSLISAINKTDDESKQSYRRVINNMINNHGYCRICAKKTLDYFCTQRG